MYTDLRKFIPETKCLWTNIILTKCVCGNNMWYVKYHHIDENNRWVYNIKCTHCDNIKIKE